MVTSTVWWWWTPVTQRSCTGSTCSLRDWPGKVSLSLPPLTNPPPARSSLHFSVLNSIIYNQDRFYTWISDYQPDLCFFKVCKRTYSAGFSKCSALKASQIDRPPFLAAFLCSRSHSLFNSLIIPTLCLIPFSSVRFTSPLALHSHPSLQAAIDFRGFSLKY